MGRFVVMPVRLSVSAGLIAVAMLWTDPAFAQGSDSVKYWVYFGTGANHIYVSSFDDGTGALSAPREAAEIGRPGFLAIHPQDGTLYAVGREPGTGGAPKGIVAAFEIDQATGDLRERNRTGTAGRGASHVSVNSSATGLAAVNYGDANTVSLPVRPDGRVGELVSDLQHSGSSVHPQRQGEPHPHSANFTPDGRLVIVPDLGTDELVAYEFDPQTAQLRRRSDPQLKMPPGSGPRHMTFHPNGRWAYVINELASTVAFLEYDSSAGSLRTVQITSTLPEGYDGPPNTTAEVLVHPNGRFLYGSNRGSNTIAVFAIDASSGRLTAVERVSTGGNWPRNFKLSPTGRFLLAANQRSDDVRVFRVDSETGRLEPTGASVSLPSPMCVRFVSAK